MGFVKVEAVVTRDRIEVVIDAVERETGHVGVTVIEAVGHGRQRGITHEYRGRVFESRFLPKAVLVFVVTEDRVGAAVKAITDAAHSGRCANGNWRSATELSGHFDVRQRMASGSGFFFICESSVAARSDGWPR